LLLSRGFSNFFCFFSSFFHRRKKYTLAAVARTAAGTPGGAYGAGVGELTLPTKENPKKLAIQTFDLSRMKKIKKI